MSPEKINRRGAVERVSLHLCKEERHFDLSIPLPLVHTEWTLNRYLRCFGPRERVYGVLGKCTSAIAYC